MPKVSAAGLKLFYRYRQDSQKIRPHSSILGILECGRIAYYAGLCISRGRFVFLPLSAEKSNRKTNNPEDPVEYHGNPHADCTPAQPLTEDITEYDSECPHRENRNHHSKAYIIGGAKCVWQYKGKRPQNHGTTVVNPNQDRG